MSKFGERLSYQVLARKYRPQVFTDMVGQEHIVDTLCNAMKYERVGHAYLFVGTRGTGKTTIARIFAKALNCLDLQENFNPCNKCQNCLDIVSDCSLDVVEIDGASNNGIEDIRSLRENTQYSPTTSKYKIYIIDEVHMLSTQAWNALLKTLEEPPKFVKFFFATTEVHKVLPTILSRCQRFDLKSISQRDITVCLEKIVGLEQVEFSKEALNTLARGANGSMRDALSMLDQMIAFCSKKEGAIEESDVDSIFGLASSDNIFALIEAMIANNSKEIIRQVHMLVSCGKHIDTLYQDLLSYLRQIMVVSISGKEAGHILKIREEEVVSITKRFSQIDSRVLRNLVDGLVLNENFLRHTLSKHLFFETILLRVSYESCCIDIDTLIGQFTKLKDQEASVDSKREFEKKKIEKEQCQEESTQVSTQTTEVKISQEKLQQEINEQEVEQVTQKEEILQDDEKLPSELLSSKQGEQAGEKLDMVSENMVEITFESNSDVINQDPLKIFSLDYTQKIRRTAPSKRSIETEQNPSFLAEKVRVNEEEFEESNFNSSQTKQAEEDKISVSKVEQKNRFFFTEHGVKVPEEIVEHPFSQEVAKSWGGLIYHFENKE